MTSYSQFVLVCRRRACDMRDLTINPAHLLGISPAKAKAAGGLPSLDTFVNVKQKHPTRPVLLRVSFTGCAACSSYRQRASRAVASCCGTFAALSVYCTAASHDHSLALC